MFLCDHLVCFFVIMWCICLGTCGLFVCEASTDDNAMINASLTLDPEVQWWTDVVSLY